jgi:hypothetical protein
MEGMCAKKKPQGWRMFRSRALEENLYLWFEENCVFTEMFTYMDMTYVSSGHSWITNEVISKVKLSLCFNNSALRQEGVWGSGCIDSRILGFGTSWSWVFSFTPWPLYPWENAPGTHWVRGWEGHRTCLDDTEKRIISLLPGLEPRPLCRPACSQLLYRLRCTGF